MKFWILLAIAGLLLFWSLTRERFVERMEGDTAQPMCTESGYTLSENKARCSFTYIDAICVPGTEWKPGFCEKKCPSGTTMVNGAVDKCMKEPMQPVCPSGFTFETERVNASRAIEMKGTCKPVSSTSSSATGATGAAATGATGTTAGGTTGGSSTTSASPNAGGGGGGKGVYGPTFTSLGSPIDGGGGDTSKTNQYPELLGGMGDTSVRTPSGIQNPSQSWLLSQSGALPSTASLGSDANAAYFPHSRSPGDQDLIPDPYRLSRNYSTASYSSKTDPVPFLTDFSAFFK